MGWGDRRAGLPPVVHDRLRVADVRVAGVLLHPIAHRGHHEAGGAIVEVGEAAAVLRREHEHLVDAAGRRLREDRPEIADRHRLVARERGIQVRHHPHLPLPAGPIRFEGWWCRLLVARAERAGSRRVGFDGQQAGSEIAGTRALGGDRHPSARERIEPKLAQRCGPGSTRRQSTPRHRRTHARCPDR